MALDGPGPRSDRSPPDADRAVSEVLGYALLLGVVFLGIAVLLFVGGDVIDRHQAEAEIGQAEQALTQFDSEASRVALDGTSSQQVDLGLRGTRGSLDVQPDAGRIIVEYEKLNYSNRTIGETHVVVDRSLGAVTYEHGETTVAYQGGGVWRSDGDGSMMVSRPEVQFREDTLTLAVIGTERGGSVHSDVQITPGAPSVQKFPDATGENQNLTNKVDDGIIRITVESEYYLAWGQYFEDDQDAIVGYDHDNERVVVEYLSVPREFSPRSGIIATAAPGDISLHGTGSYVSSYDSSTGETWEDTREGIVESAGDVNLWGSAEIAGDVYTGGHYETHSGSAEVHGDVYWTDGFEDGHGGVHGDDEEIPGVSSVPPITDYVKDRVATLQATNDNAQTDAIDDGQLVTDPHGSATLSAGEYYFESLHLDDREELELDTTEGDITIAVHDWVGLESRSDIEVTGDGGDVHIYVEGRNKIPNDDRITGAEDHVPPDHVEEKDVEWSLFTDRGASVTIEGDDRDATRLTVYGPEDFTAGFGGPDVAGEESSFTGLVYAPAGTAGHGYAYIKQAHLYGGIVTGDLTIDQYGEVYFDYALKDKELPVAPTLPRLEYLHVSEHEIRVEDT